MNIYLEFAEEEFLFLDLRDSVNISIYSAYINLEFSNDYSFAQNLYPNLIIKHDNYFFANTINIFIEKIS